MEWYKILVTGFFSFPIALTVILEGPGSAVYPEGTNVTLQCIAKVERNRIVWEDIKESVVIFIDKTKNTQRAKFENFFINDAEENFSLTIVNAQPSDDGFYSCEEGDESRNANLTIEAGPALSVFVNNTLLVPEKGINLTEDDQVVVKCKAEGAKPAVHLTLKFGENEWIETNNITTSDDGLRFTTETSVTHPVSRDDTTVTCKATGQISIPPSSAEISINVLYKPVCRVGLKRNIAECQCISNPQVFEYKWWVNGTLQGTELLLQIHEYIPANLTCLATNAVGTGALASRYVSSTNIDGATSISKAIVIIVIVAVILCVIIVCSLFFCCLCKQRRDKLPFYDALDVTSEPQVGQSVVQSNDDDEYKDAEGEQMELGGGQSSVSRSKENGGEANDDQGDESKPGESKSSIKSNDNGDENESKSNSADKNGESNPLLSRGKESNDDDQGDESKPGESKSSIKSNDNGEENESKSNSADKNGESNPLLSRGKESNDDAQCDNSEPEESASSEESEDDEKCIGVDRDDAKCVGTNYGNRPWSLRNGDPTVQKYTSWTPFISRITAVISHDWEIFAIEDLHLKRKRVKKIIRQYPEVSDQLSAALKHWAPSFTVEAMSNLERNILPESKVYSYYMGGENNATSSTNKTEKAGFDEFPHVATFSEVMADVGKCVGHIGAYRLSLRYRDLNFDPFTDSKIPTLTGESYINLLQTENLLTDDMKSLKRLKKALDDSLLLRASHLVDTFINEKEKRELNVSSTEDVLQQSKHDGATDHMQKHSGTNV